MTGSVSVNGEELCTDFTEGESFTTTFSVEADVPTDGPTDGPTDSPIDCVNVDVTISPDTYGSEMSFSLTDECSLPVGEMNREPVTVACCLMPGMYTLTCEDSYGDGWAYGDNMGSVMIGEEMYCTDFATGYLLTASVEIVGDEVPTEGPTDMPTDTDAP
eukprot:UN24843